MTSNDTPNQETINAMKEVEEMKKDPKKYKGYDSAEDMFNDILSEDDDSGD